MKKTYSGLFATAILFGLAFGWKGLLAIGVLFPIVWLSSFFEPDPSPKTDQDTDAASLAAISCGDE